MEIRFMEPNKKAPKGYVEIDDCKIIWRNFSGRQTAYNRKGDKNFTLVIPTEDMAEALKNEGYNVKIKPPREEGDVPFMYMRVKINFNDRGPNVYLKSGEEIGQLNEESACVLDDISISRVDMDIIPYDWETNGKKGRTAYLQSIKVTQDISDRFANEYAEQRRS